MAIQNPAAAAAALRQQGLMRPPMTGAQRGLQNVAQSRSMSQSPWWGAASGLASLIPGLGPIIGAGMGAYGLYNAISNPESAWGKEGYNQQMPLHTPEQMQYMHGMLSNLGRGNYQQRALEGLAQGPTPIEQQYANMYMGMAPQFAQQFSNPYDLQAHPFENVLNSLVQRYGPQAIGPQQTSSNTSRPMMGAGRYAHMKGPNTNKRPIQTGHAAGHKHTQSCKGGSCKRRK